MHQNFNRAKLMVCASCEWIFKSDEPVTGAPPTLNYKGCPKCGWGHYTAHYVYGKKAYRYAKTQKNYKNQKG